MRATTASILLTALIGLTLSACHKKAESDADAPHGLKVEAYDAPIAKAPNKGGKLDVMRQHPEAAASVAPPPLSPAPAPASSEPPADKPQAVLETPAPAVRRLAVLLIAAPAAAKVNEQHFDLYDSPTYQTQTAAPPAAQDAQPGFRITLPVCQRADRMSDPLAKTAECMSLLDQGKEHQRLCAKAFEAGDDKVVLSPACRQAATFR